MNVAQYNAVPTAHCQCCSPVLSVATVRVIISLLAHRKQLRPSAIPNCFALYTESLTF